MDSVTISSELDVAFEMDDVEIQEEPWDDNDSNSDDDVDSGITEDEQELQVTVTTSKDPLLILNSRSVNL